MAALDEPSTYSRWLSQPGPIELRHTDHVPQPTPGRGIVLAALIGAFVLLFAYAAYRWFGA